MSKRGYSPRDWREVVSDTEPCSIDAKVVSDFLESRGRPEMAAFIRHIGRIVQERNEREIEMRDAYTRLRERLEQYEPSPAPFITPSCVPPPESSD